MKFKKIKLVLIWLQGTYLAVFLDVVFIVIFVVVVVVFVVVVVVVVVLLLLLLHVHAKSLVF